MSEEMTPVVDVPVEEVTTEPVEVEEVPTPVEEVAAPELVEEMVVEENGSRIAPLPDGKWE